jgi:hypothetical protein
MYTPGFAAPEMYRRDTTMGPWTDIYAIGACMFACIHGFPPSDAPQRVPEDKTVQTLKRLQGVYSDDLLEIVQWCMALDPQKRPQTVFALQKELNRTGARRFTQLTMADKVKLQLGSVVENTKKTVHKVTEIGKYF